MADVSRGAVRDGMAAAHARLLADHRLQFAFAPPPAQRSSPGWLLAFLRWLAALGRRAPHRRAPEWAAYLPWVVLAFVVIGVLVLLARGFAPEIARRRAHRTTPITLHGHDDWRPDARRAHALLEDADGLARQERFAEAAQMLLFRSIADLETRLPQAIAPSLTSRDIAALPGWPAAPQAAFASIAALVEHAVFGGRVVGASDWASCRAAYTRFAFDGDWTPT